MSMTPMILLVTPLTPDHFKEITALMHSLGCPYTAAPNMDSLLKENLTSAAAAIKTVADSALAKMGASEAVVARAPAISPTEQATHRPDAKSGKHPNSPTSKLPKVPRPPQPSGMDTIVTLERTRAAGPSGPLISGTAPGATEVAVQNAPAKSPRKQATHRPDAKSGKRPNSPTSKLPKVPRPPQPSGKDTVVTLERTRAAGPSGPLISGTTPGATEVAVQNAPAKSPTEQVTHRSDANSERPQSSQNWNLPKVPRPPQPPANKDTVADADRNKAAGPSGTVSRLAPGATKAAVANVPASFATKEDTHRSDANSGKPQNSKLSEAPSLPLKFGNTDSVVTLDPNNAAGPSRTVSRLAPGATTAAAANIPAIAPTEQATHRSIANSGNPQNSQNWNLPKVPCPPQQSGNKDSVANLERRNGAGPSGTIIKMAPAATKADVAKASAKSTTKQDIHRSDANSGKPQNSQNWNLPKVPRSPQTSANKNSVADLERNNGAGPSGTIGWLAPGATKAVVAKAPVSQTSQLPKVPRLPQNAGNMDSVAHLERNNAAGPSGPSGPLIPGIILKQVKVEQISEVNTPPLYPPPIRDVSTGQGNNLDCTVKVELVREPNAQQQQSKPVAHMPSVKREANLGQDPAFRIPSQGSFYGNVPTFGDVPAIFPTEQDTPRFNADSGRPHNSQNSNLPKVPRPPQTSANNYVADSGRNNAAGPSGPLIPGIVLKQVKVEPHLEYDFVEEEFGRPLQTQPMRDVSAGQGNNLDHTVKVESAQEPNVQQELLKGLAYMPAVMRKGHPGQDPAFRIPQGSLYGNVPSFGVHGPQPESNSSRSAGNSAVQAALAAFPIARSSWAPQGNSVMGPVNPQIPRQMQYPESANPLTKMHQMAQGGPSGNRPGTSRQGGSSYAMPSASDQDYAAVVFAKDSQPVKRTPAAARHHMVPPVMGPMNLQDSMLAVHQRAAQDPNFASCYDSQGRLIIKRKTEVPSTRPPMAKRPRIENGVQPTVPENSRPAAVPNDFMGNGHGNAMQDLTDRHQRREAVPVKHDPEWQIPEEEVDEAKNARILALLRNAQEAMKTEPERKTKRSRRNKKSMNG